MAKSSKKQGFVILYAVLLTMVVLAIGIILLNIIARQTLLASIERNSQIAYYAADAGRQCALYWNKQQKFGTVINILGIRQLSAPAAIDGVSCVNAEPVTVTTDPGLPLASGAQQLKAEFRIPISSKTCARVTVEKNAAADPDKTTIVTSVGYNVACDSVDTVNPRKVERALRITTI